MNKTILLIDDDEDEQEIFAQALTTSKAKYSFLYCSSVKQALSKLHASIPDFIFIDMNMPEINGLECIELFRRNTNLSAIPLILYSVGMNKSLCETALAKGASFCLKKSAFNDELTETLKNLLSGAGFKPTPAGTALFLD